MNQKIREAALGAGIPLIGFCTPQIDTRTKNAFQNWLETGMHADMAYLHKTRNTRRVIEEFLPGQKSVIICGFPYPAVESKHVVSYALINDYHALLHEKLETFCLYLTKAFSGIKTKVFIDTLPVLEKVYASKAGLGCIGKNTLLLSKKYGSRLFLGGIMTDLEIEHDGPEKWDPCGSCRKCIDACPTRALDAYVLDARKCISYHTIENKGEIPEDITEKMGEMVYGCGICEKVCPWNNKNTVVPGWDVYEDLANADVETLKILAGESFKKHFGKTPVYHSGKRVFLRNIVIAVANKARQ
ncbi:MAG: tRNA epoxyqueuosine(34) reductase QueG [Candidatus Raymondbacteria bacterium RifOxyA12_full_50_37]|uniref:tRNA epoxyqueuosine(34) reductase QueG n=1 Tax=Candidatus Raymondbacteria bacterium RIFOXYD12_FULL_49_13 TaxID=1817890 RepID=A0A1F7F3D9_UNCRA|nr:MAG: tRNA epoxyqueuosine(34) reductase QueG [Candidatus Raymondbacteria bacterium RifOxyA12_full_50_37]OGJ89150.1 MAG: tRNA epoxyqueuosine(34) reductase QueG [Candidatus Raymondbacteria bacterium RIFOXYA2_FULL_49_16]OGJ96632.1 MAG: tRNA epoxyqueuosine(34) reductase QueG [Candidatus Raymondbacteria bacterium RIFOXYC2_FULL_50_21]OGK01083.1 MAG: tRNA epoxyqueuosine(34) reductase QueG [Candidatus Raymondbacteria bacterium RIFOXYD12_FULL_49_13]OGK01430.1 MAG: tRNA epoxyqueuosine(34) reductase Que